MSPLAAPGRFSRCWDEIRKGISATALVWRVAFMAHLARTGAASSCTRRGASGPRAWRSAGRPRPAGQRGGGRATFPAQQRSLADEATIARGKTLYEINCRACHGADLRGGDIGGPNLLRSQLVLNDQHGELILPVVKNGRQNPGHAADAGAAARRGRRQGGRRVHPQRRLHDARPGLAAAGRRSRAQHRGRRRQGGRGVTSPPSARRATRRPAICRASRRASRARCSCRTHWITGGGGRGAAAPRRPGARPVTVTVTPSNGSKIEGRLVRIDDFFVVIATEDGTHADVPAHRRHAEGARSTIRSRASQAADRLHRQRHSRRDRLSGDPEMTLETIVLVTSLVDGSGRCSRSGADRHTGAGARRAAPPATPTAKPAPRPPAPAVGSGSMAAASIRPPS